MKKKSVVLSTLLSVLMLINSFQVYAYYLDHESDKHQHGSELHDHEHENGESIIEVNEKEIEKNKYSNNSSCFSTEPFYVPLRLEYHETEHKSDNKATVTINSSLDSDFYRITYSSNSVVKINY